MKFRRPSPRTCLKIFALLCAIWCFWHPRRMDALFSAIPQDASIVSHHVGLAAEWKALVRNETFLQILERAGVDACPNRVAAVYLELAVLVRALQGLDDAARLDTAPDRSSLWAGLFDLHDTLYGATVDDLRALAA